MVSRRDVLGGSAALAASLTLGGPGRAQPVAGQTLRFATYGGVWVKVVASTIEQIFRAKTNASVEYVTGIPAQHLATLVAARGQTPPFDLVSFTADLTVTAVAQGLVQPIDASHIPNIAKLPPRLQPTASHGPCDYLGLEGILYDAAKYREMGLKPPTDFDSLADPALAGRVAIPDITFSFKQVYAAINKIKTGDETDFSGTVKWLASLKSPVIYNDSPTLQTRFDTGEIWAMIGVSGYAPRWPKREVAFVNPPVGKNRGIIHQSTLEIPKGTPRQALAEQFIDAWLSDEGQKSIANLGFSPSNSVAAAAVVKESKTPSIFISTPEEVDALYNPDWVKVNAAYSDWVDQWNRALRR